MVFISSDNMMQAHPCRLMLMYSLYRIVCGRNSREMHRVKNAKIENPSHYVRGFSGLLMRAGRDLNP